MASPRARSEAGIRALVLTVALVAAAPAALAVAPAAAAGDPGSSVSGPYQDETAGWIQPGDRVEPVGGDSWCTLNFVVTDGEDYFVGTAGHCFAEGAAVQVDGETVGTVEAREFGGLGGPDWGFVRIEEEHEDDVNPTVSYWQGPVKVPSSNRTPTPARGAAGDVARLVRPQTGDALFYYGHGSQEDRNQRTGNAVHWSPGVFRFVGSVSGGDSGGPILNTNGQAVGIVVSRLGAFSGGYSFQSALLSFESELDRDLTLVPGEAFPADPGDVCRYRCPSDAASGPAPADEGTRLLPGPSPEYAVR